MSRFVLDPCGTAVSCPHYFAKRVNLTSICAVQCSIAECILYDEQLPAKVHLIPRPGRSSRPRQQRVYETSPFFSFHHGNAHEANETTIIIDTIAWDSLSFSGFNLEALSADYYK